MNLQASSRVKADTRARSPALDRPRRCPAGYSRAMNAAWMARIEFFWRSSFMTTARSLSKSAGDRRAQSNSSLAASSLSIASSDSAVPMLIVCV